VDEPVISWIRLDVTCHESYTLWFWKQLFHIAVSYRFHIDLWAISYGFHMTVSYRFHKISYIWNSIWNTLWNIIWNPYETSIEYYMKFYMKFMLMLYETYMKLWENSYEIVYETKENGENQTITEEEHQHHNKEINGNNQNTFQPILSLLTWESLCSFNTATARNIRQSVLSCVEENKPTILTSMFLTWYHLVDLYYSWHDTMIMIPSLKLETKHWMIQYFCR